MILDCLLFLVGLALLIYLSPKIVKYASLLAEVLDISPIIIGIIVIAIGTSIPEITNSITSSIMGHGDINVGDTIGSCLSQITLLLGLVALFGGTIRTERKNLFLMGSGMVMATILAFSIIEKGYITRMNGIILILSYVGLFYIVQQAITKKEYLKRERKEFVFTDFWNKYTLYLLLSLVGLVGGSLLVVSSVINLSNSLGMPEYIISFIAVGLGTSLPELSVAFSAIKEKKFELIIGNVLGSNLTDLTLSLGVGPLLAPNIIESNLINATGGYLIIVSLIVVFIFGINRKIDRKTGAFFIFLYLLSFPIIFSII